MLTYWMDMDRAFSQVDDVFERFMDAFAERAACRGFVAQRSAAYWPPVSVHDAGKDLVVKAEVPGLTEKDIEISVHQDVLTLSGERRIEAPEGHEPVRQERAAYKFTRSFPLPAHLDAEKATAVLKNGILTLTIAKSPEAQPRTIAVKAK
jgi:HSP20 family protein